MKGKNLFWLSMMENHEDIIYDLHSIAQNIILSGVSIPELVPGSGIYGIEIVHDLSDLGCVIIDFKGCLKIIDINMLGMVVPEIGINNSLSITDLDVGLYETTVLFATMIRQLSETKKLLV